MKHKFVESIPDKIEEGTIYISIPFDTIIHKCCCGCDNEVVTPLSPTDWSLIYNGETVSLSPSIGNWNFECKSHYWIDKSKVRWATKWSEDEIRHGQNYDKKAKEQYYNSKNQKEIIDDQSMIRRFIKNDSLLKVLKSFIDRIFH